MPAVLSFFFSSRRRHTRSKRDWSSDVCSSDLARASPLREALSFVHLLALRLERASRGREERLLESRRAVSPLQLVRGLEREQPAAVEDADALGEIGRASCRERGGAGGVCECRT